MEMRPGKIRSTIEARRYQATTGGMIRKKKNQCQKKFHHDCLTSSSSSSTPVEPEAEDSAPPAFSATGKPHDGQAVAEVETCFPHSGQLMSAIRLNLTETCNQINPV